MKIRQTNVPRCFLLLAATTMLSLSGTEARADGVGPGVPNGLPPILLTVTEGLQPNPVTIDAVTWTNTNAFTETFVFDPLAWGYESGDPTDQVTDVSMVAGYGGCNPGVGIGTVLLAGQSCDEYLRIYFPDEIDYGDSGLSIVTLTAHFANPTSPATNYSFLVQVNDLPEPSSLALLGIGAAGLLAMALVRRKRVTDGSRRQAAEEL